MKQIIAFLSTNLIALSLYSQCSGNEPIIFLGNDTVVCQGQNLVLTAANGYDIYTWSTNQTTPSISINTSGTYSVEAVIQMGTNDLVVNGKFENGATGFTTDYISGTGGTWGLLSNPGQYAVSTSPSNVHNNFNFCGDHTTGNGKMYIANGSDLANTIVWSQTIAVQPNTNYNFSTWVTSVENTSNPAILQFFVNNIQIGNVFSPTTNGCDWTQFYNLWNSGSNTTATISIKNQNTDGGGNDFALDDISFIPYCSNQDTITVIFDTIVANAGQDLTFCSNEPEQLIGSSNTPGSTYLWNTTQTQSSIIPTNSGLYTLTVTSPNGCSDTDNANVNINQTPTASFTATPTTEIVPFEAVLTNESQNATTYFWDFGNGLTQTTMDLSSVSSIYQTIGDYTITLIASNASNCFDTSRVEIHGILPENLIATNVFSPNGDGVNDEYQFRLENISELNLTILNRWGIEVNSISDPSQTWNGKDKTGEDCLNGVYFYKYSAKGAMKNTFEGQGFIHLIK
jgi:gliding motility-associated-like protein